MSTPPSHALPQRLADPDKRQRRLEGGADIPVCSHTSTRSLEIPCTGTAPLPAPGEGSPSDSLAGRHGFFQTAIVLKKDTAGEGIRRDVFSRPRTGVGDQPPLAQEVNEMTPPGEFVRAKERVLILFSALLISTFSRMRISTRKFDKPRYLQPAEDVPHGRSGWKPVPPPLPRSGWKPAVARFAISAPFRASPDLSSGLRAGKRLRYRETPLKSPPAYVLPWCRSDPYRSSHPLSGKSRSAMVPSYDCPTPSTWNRERRRMRSP